MTLEEKKLLLLVARKSVEGSLHNKSLFDKNVLLKFSAKFKNIQATFVTITLDNRLRGCIGSLIAHRTLLDDVISNSNSAAFKDPRFPDLTVEEFNASKFEISILSEPVFYKFISKEDLINKIQVGIDGIILEVDGRKATYLPSVWEQLPTFDLFFDSLKQKAGITVDIYTSNPKIWIYHASKFKEQ